jgi:hypothetical protein
MTLLDAQLRWMMLHGYATWHCYRCSAKFSSMISTYHHLVDHHGLDPTTAFREGEGQELVELDDVAIEDIRRRWR